MITHGTDYVNEWCLTSSFPTRQHHARHREWGVMIITPPPQKGNLVSDPTGGWKRDTWNAMSRGSSSSIKWQYSFQVSGSSTAAGERAEHRWLNTAAWCQEYVGYRSEFYVRGAADELTTVISFRSSFRTFVNQYRNRRNWRIVWFFWPQAAGWRFLVALGTIIYS